MKDKNMPELINPMNSIMMNGMPNLPQIISGAMPKFIPPADFSQNPVSLWYGNKKVGQLAKRAEHEFDIARNATGALKEKLEAIHAVVTFSSRVADSLDEYEHKKAVRKLTQQNIQFLNDKLEMETKRIEIETYKLQAEASSAGYDAKISELDFKVRLKQYKEQFGED